MGQTLGLGNDLAQVDLGEQLRHLCRRLLSHLRLGGP
jgi:hypothetical protein